MRYHPHPRVVGINHKPHVSVEAVCRAVQHAMTQPIDRFAGGIMGGYLSYDGNGLPIDGDDPDAEILDAITIETEYAVG